MNRLSGGELRPAQRALLDAYEHATVPAGVHLLGVAARLAVTPAAADALAALLPIESRVRWGLPAPQAGATEVRWIDLTTAERQALEAAGYRPPIDAGPEAKELRFGDLTPAEQEVFLRAYGGAYGGVPGAQA